MALTPSSQLGPYEILARLGAGGMGEVYRARDPRLGREVAIKVLPADVASNRERLERLEREARTVAGLNHPNIVVLYSIEEHDGVRLLTMELVDGQTLASVIVPGGLPLSRLLGLAVPLADALVAAHERGVAHRDLKPGNVMVTREGRVKVLDFGLARMFQPGPALDLTRAETLATPISEAGQVVGTVPYMAPEQIRGHAVDASCDLFAFGIILYELATGKRPFIGETHVDIGHAILHAAPEALARVRSDLPAEFERIVSRCLEKDPRARMPSANELLDSLRRLGRALERGEALAPAQDGPDKMASIAVLPFVNRSANADDEYFSDGLADELIGVLAKIRGLRVAARSSSFQFKGRNVQGAWNSQRGAPALSAGATSPGKIHGGRYGQSHRVFPEGRESRRRVRDCLGGTGIHLPTAGGIWMGGRDERRRTSPPGCRAGAVPGTQSG
jgi:serine/threonine protein kinase